MKRAFFFLAAALAAQPLSAREVVEASAPTETAVTIYRDPNGGGFNKNYPRGFAMISETRTVTLPPGESTIRFVGVSEGMIAISAIVSGLPGGTIEKNRNADLLSPAALVDGTLGNRVTITRTDPATGVAQSEDAVVRTRADGGLVLETSEGFEAVRCSGLPEKLTFDSVPDGLYAQPLFTIDTRDPTGGTYEVTLTYLSWGFDWRAHYVATLQKGGRRGDVGMRMLSWLTLVNDNGQSFADTDLMVVAGTLNVESNYRQLAAPPRASGLRLTCWPIGSTAAGSPLPIFPKNELEAEAMYDSASAIVVTGSRAPPPPPPPPPPPAPAMVANEENLGDLKLFRVPEPVTVSAKGLKQVAFLARDDVQGDFVYESECYFGGAEGFDAAELLFETENVKEHGLGQSLPTGGVTVFEPTPRGDLLIGEDDIRDYALGEDVEVSLGESTKVFARCVLDGEEPDDNTAWRTLRAEVTNSGSRTAEVRLMLGYARDYEVRKGRRLAMKDGQHMITLRAKPGKTSKATFQIREVDREEE